MATYKTPTKPTFDTRCATPFLKRLEDERPGAAPKGGWVEQEANIRARQAVDGLHSVIERAVKMLGQMQSGDWTLFDPGWAGASGRMPSEVAKAEANIYALDGLLQGAHATAEAEVRR